MPYFVSARMQLEHVEPFYDRKIIANEFIKNIWCFSLTDDMMIPSEMPVLSQLSQSRGGENGHGSPFSDAGNMFSANPSDMLRSGSGLFGAQFGPDQMQMLQSLQQIGQKHKEVRNKVYTSSYLVITNSAFHPAT